MNELLAQLFGSQPSYAGQLLGEDEARRLQQQAQQSGLLNVGLALLAGAGPSPQRRGVGELLAQGVMAGQQAYQGAYNKAVQERALMEQLAERRQAQADIQAAQQAIQQSFAPREMYGEDIMGQRVGVGMTAPMLDTRRLEGMLASLTPGARSQVLKEAGAIQSAFAPKRITAKEGERILEEAPGGGLQQVYAVPPKPEKAPGAFGQAMLALGLSGSPENLTPTQLQQVRVEMERQAKASAPKLAVDMTDPTAVAKQQLTTMNQWQGYLKDSGDSTVAVRAAAFYDAVKLANEQNNTSADSALIYNLAKIYDPQGAVQQGDINTIVGNPSIPMAIQKLAQRVSAGGTFLPKERQNMKNLVEGIVREREKALKPMLEEYRQINKGLGGRESAINNPYDLVRRRSLGEILGGEER